MRLLRCCVAAVALLLLSTVAQAQSGAKVLVVGNFGSETAGTTTVPANPRLPDGTSYPAQDGWADASRRVVADTVARLVTSFPAASIGYANVVNTQGDLGTGIVNFAAALTALNGTTPDAVIIADDFDISDAVQRLVTDRYGSDVTIFMARSATTNVNSASPTVAPATLRIVPSDGLVMPALTNAIVSFGWQSVSLLYTNDGYGSNFMPGLAAAFDALNNPPRVLGSEVLTAWSNPNRDAADVTSLINLARAGARGVVAVGCRGFATRVLNAARRAAATEPRVNNLFFLFTSEALFEMPAGLDLTAAAFLVPRFTRRGLSSSFPENIADPLSYVLSHVIDSLNVIGWATDAINGQTDKTINGRTIFAKAVTATISDDIGKTGAISFVAGTLNRLQAEFSVLRPAPTSNSVFVRISSVILNPLTNGWVSTLAVNNIVPVSSNNVVEVCLIGSDTCADMANVNHALLTLLDANAGNVADPTAPKLPTGVTVKPTALAAGTTGVRAIAAVSKNAKNCDFIIGPARTTLAIAINPLVTYYAIPTLDYGSSSSALSDRLTYPYYSRVVPTDTKSSRALASTYAYLGWDTVAVITTKDTYGMSLVADFTAALNEKKIVVEDQYYLDSHADPQSALRTALRTIRDNLVTRIVYVALPWGNELLSDFFAALNELGMETTHYWTLSDTLCQFTAANPAKREPLVGSICIEPNRQTGTYQPVYQKLLASGGTQAKSILAQGGFDTVNCNLDNTDIYSAYAHDAAFTVVETIRQLVGFSVANGTGSQVSSALADGLKTVINMRLTRVSGYTGTVDFDLSGDRLHASFIAMIQQRVYGPIPLGIWSETSFIPVPGQIYWQDNTTTVPKASTRSISFIAKKTASTNPAMIVISVLGFIVTIGVMVFCFKYNQMQKKAAGIDAERSMESKIEMTKNHTSVRMDSRPQSRPVTPSAKPDRSA